jgi:hypothetical protein
MIPARECKDFAGGVRIESLDASVSVPLRDGPWLTEDDRNCLIECSSRWKGARRLYGRSSPGSSL